ncbi:hemicentin-1-like [Mastacembelus armatus]|uniref:hemicentin-1-like n=1 Tax=Mastacembelus armatus TaxID=205130 RepID=UPI000E45E892|nr:hemicentin-1-like [Mastacembelus armatus]XP_026159976.1 hemicentin-1-like [Mastacembelus armatus]
MTGAAMSLTAAASGFVVFLLSVSVVQAQDGWGVTYTATDICAIKGSTVNIRCTYRYPSKIEGRVTVVEETLWFAKVSDYEPVDLRIASEYSGHVQYQCEDKTCTLTIRDLRETDSAQYKFRFITNQPGGSYTGSPGVTLSVKALQVQVSDTNELRCHSSCGLPDGPSYIWYKNGQKVHGEPPNYSGNIDGADSYSCALKGREDSPSPPVCVKGQNCNRVTYTDRSICAFKGSSVDISCTYNSHDKDIRSKFWFSPERSGRWQSPSQPEDLSEDSQFAGRVQVLDPETGRSTLRITDLRETDSAQYHFTFKTPGFEWRSSLPGTTLTVTDPDLQVVVKRSLSWSYVKCRSSCFLPEHVSYIWYLNGKMIPIETSDHSGIFHITDSYSCALKGREDFPSPPVCANGQSCNRVTYTDRSICAFKGSSVDISCTYNSHDKDIQSKFWFSPERSGRWQNLSQPEDLSEDSQFAGRVQVLDPETGRSTLRITDLRETDSAQYHFTFKTPGFEWRSSLPGTTLTVTAALQVQVTRVTVLQSYTEAELKCLSSDSPAGGLTYVWFQNGQKVPDVESASYKGRFGPGDNISCALKEHEACPSPPVYGPKLLSVSVSPSAEIVEGSPVTLTCSSDANPAANYTWYKENQTLIHGPEGTYQFTSISSEDRGTYYCRSENQLGQSNSSSVSIDVQYGPKLLSVSVSPSAEIVEGSSVTLTCSSDANPAAKYTWYKRNHTLLSKEPQLLFSSIQSSDSGEYYCTAENDLGTSTKNMLIDVKYPPKLLSVSVSPSAEIVEGSSVTLTCSSDANPAAKYTWYKENQTLIHGPEGTYQFSSISSEDSGTYYCRSENKYGQINSSSLFIDVQYPPKLLSVSVSPSAEIVEGSPVTLTCSSDANPAAKYTWYKENEESPKASGQIFNITDISPEHSGKYYCEAQNTRGRHNTTLYLTVVAVFPQAWKSVIGTATAVFFAIIFFLIIIIIVRKKRSSKKSSGSEVKPEPREQNLPSQSEQQDNLHYASIHFSKNRADPIYSNMRGPELHRHKEEEDDSVEYTSVVFKSDGPAARTRGQETREDPDALYSTVNKTR